MLKFLFAILAIATIAESVQSFTGFSLLNHFENQKNKLMKKHLDNIHRNATSLSHYDEDFDDYESDYFDHVEKYKRQGKSPERAHASAYSKMEMQHGSKFTNAMRKGNSTQLQHGNKKVSAQFDIKITRNTANIVGIDLPVPLFGAIHYNARYLSIIPSFLPAGVLLSGIAIDNNGNVVFTYTQNATGFTDTITVGCNQIPYITFLDGSKLNAQKVSKTLYQISNVNFLNQFGSLFKTFEKGIYGKLDGNDISVSATNLPNITNFVAREVKTGFNITYENSVVIGIIAQAGFIVTLSMDVSKYDRTNLVP